MRSRKGHRARPFPTTSCGGLPWPTPFMAGASFMSALVLLKQLNLQCLDFMHIHTLDVLLVQLKNPGV